MKSLKVKSSFIQGLSYQNKILRVFMTSGAAYTYKGVPRDVAARFVRAESKGRFYNKNIKNEYDQVG